MVLYTKDKLPARPKPQRSKVKVGNPTQIEAQGVNHMEMGTHSETERILRVTWDGANGDEFRIPR